jgi:PIN domain nuclease of toxin-antitoxin system
MIVLDTHALIWWTLDPDRLSNTARKHCLRLPKTGACISSISIWEIGIKVKRGHLDLGLTIDSFLGRLQRLSWLEIAPVTAANWIANVNLDWEHRDPADRTIVALAQMRALPLLSKNETIRAYYPLTVW